MNFAPPSPVAPRYQSRINAVLRAFVNAQPRRRL